MIVGLTGSIAMGKSTTAQMFEKLGYPVFDADKAVHGLYQKGGEAAEKISQAFPDVIKDGTVDRSALAAKISQDNTVLSRLEKIVHPLVQKSEKQFITDSKKAGIDIILLDIPLLFEAGRSQEVDVVVVVSADAAQQRARALKRPGMTVEKFDLILKRQLPDAQKRAKADYVIDTSKSLEDTCSQVQDLVEKLVAINQDMER